MCEAPLLRNTCTVAAVSPARLPLSRAVISPGLCVPGNPAPSIALQSASVALPPYVGTPLHGGKSASEHQQSIPAANSMAGSSFSLPRPEAAIASSTPAAALPANAPSMGRPHSAATATPAANGRLSETIWAFVSIVCVQAVAN